jgi:sigma-B regulation protein RsbU (phosphoserine phosphatase)
LNPTTAEFMFSNAGHPPIIKISGNGQNIKLLDSNTGIPLGIKPNFQFGQNSIHLASGDAIIFITDGVTEAKNKNGDEYGKSRLLEVLSQSNKSAQEFVDTLVNDIQDFSKGTEQHDDLTIVVLKWL